MTARSQTPGRGGMVIDFGDLKTAAGMVLDGLDHRFLNEIPPFDRIEPSAENIAAFIFDRIAEQLGEQSQMLHCVAVWESDSSKATYFKD